MKNKIKIPVSSPIISQTDKQAVIDAVNKGWFTEGTQCVQFASRLASITGKKHCSLVNSGSSANLVALTAALEKWNTGKLIITSALAFPTTVAPIYQNGKVPVYVDTDPETLSPDIGQIAYLLDKHGDNIAGGIFTHTLGYPFDEHAVRFLLEDRFFISDNCDALNSHIHGKHVGMSADISTYSFFPAHHITTAGEGGAICTSDDELFKIIRSVSNWGRDCHCKPGQSNVCGKRFEHRWDTLPEGYDHKYTFTRLGYNLKMTELQAAMGVSQLDNLDGWKLDRQVNSIRLRNLFNRFKEYVSTVKFYDWSDPNPFGFPVMMKIKGYTQDFINHLENNGIATRRIFAGNITKQPGFSKLPYIYLDLDNSDYLMENAFWVGCGPWMTNEQLYYIEEKVTEWFDLKGLL